MAKLKTRIRMYRKANHHVVWVAEYKPSFFSLWNCISEYSVVSFRDSAVAVELCKKAIDNFRDNCMDSNGIIKYPENQ